MYGINCLVHSLPSTAKSFYFNFYIVLCPIVYNGGIIACIYFYILGEYKEKN